MSITQLENLSNEVLYEIFEYLDIYFVYNTFSNLNIRFQYLLKYSSLPIKLHLSWISKSTFTHCCQHIIAPNLTQIISLNISNPLAINLFLTSFPIDHSFNRLESLNLGRTHADHIISLLICLKSLPRFYSLSITIDNPADDINTIYQLITTLPVLNYCKISSENGELIFTLPIFPRTNKQKESTITHLIINGVCRLEQLDAILSYTPQLTHLSCHSVQTNNDQIFEAINVLNLKKLYIDLGSIPFNLFKLFICKISSQLEILRISANYDKTYLDAHQWQQLISYWMPHLRIFDFQFKSELCDGYNKSMEYDVLIEQFNSKFWVERNWFFVYQNCRSNSGLFKIFYSIHPYRRNYYKLYEHATNNFRILSAYQDNSIHMCRHVLIENQWMNTNCLIRFPYATKLTLTAGYAAEMPSWFNHLSSIISLTQITELILNYDYLFLNKFLILLQYMPNITFLTVPQLTLLQTNSSENALESIRIVSKTNRIRKVTIIHRECTLKQLRFLFDLCPQMEYLTINSPGSNEELIIEFLIFKMKPNNSPFHLLSLASGNANNNIPTKIQSIINRNNLPDNYSLDLFKGNIYLWC